MKDDNWKWAIFFICWWIFHASSCGTSVSKMQPLSVKVRPHIQKFSCTTWYNMVVWHMWMVWATCVVRHFMLCDQDREPPNVIPLQKKFVRHNDLTKLLCAIWHNLNIFVLFFTLQSRQIYKKNRGCVDVGRTTTFCLTTTRFMSHNLVVQSCMTKLLSVWMHLNREWPTSSASMLT